MSMISAVFGIYFAFNDEIRNAIVCLMISGFCDTFDGRIARLKKRDARELNYGIQIDSMADLISFGALPAAIAFAVSRQHDAVGAPSVVIAAIYVLATLIRLSYFNAIELEVQHSSGNISIIGGNTNTSTITNTKLRHRFRNRIKLKHKNKEKKERKYFKGLPTTSISLIIPVAYAVCNITETDFYAVFNTILVFVSILFVLNFRVPKPSVRTQVILCLIGLPIVIWVILSA
jgi:CDP-diacylglycerol--serine O-phosphatidyltransferase